MLSRLKAKKAGLSRACPPALSAATTASPEWGCAFIIAHAEAPGNPRGCQAPWNASKTKSGPGSFAKRGDRPPQAGKMDPPVIIAWLCDGWRC